MDKKIIFGIALFASGVAAFLLMDRFLDGLADQSSCVEATAKRIPVITFTDNGISPPCTIIQSGQTVTWVNGSKKPIQVSSDPHPVHSDNPEISDGKFVLQLGLGEKTSTVLIKKGTFGFHDHIKPSFFGKIIIK